MDDYYEIESSLGEAVRDQLLKSVSTIITKTSRINDVTCRTSTNKIAMVLPHCSKKEQHYAQNVCAELVQRNDFRGQWHEGVHQLGESAEYPSLCDSAKTLDETSTKALNHINDKGGKNKICLYKVRQKPTGLNLRWRTENKN